MTRLSIPINLLAYHYVHLNVSHYHFFWLQLEDHYYYVGKVMCNDEKKVPIYMRGSCGSTFAQALGN